MRTVAITKAKEDLSKIVKEANDSHIPIRIAGRNDGVVVLAERDWDAIQETLYLLSIPGLREKLREGMSIPLNKCAEKLSF